LRLRRFGLNAFKYSEPPIRCHGLFLKRVGKHHRLEPIVKKGTAMNKAELVEFVADKTDDTKAGAAVTRLPQQSAIARAKR
jgi:hypothetical protein